MFVICSYSSVSDRERKPQSMDSRYYPGVEADVFKLVGELRTIFDQDYEVQTMHVSSTTVVQARKSSTLRDLTGLSAALTIKITPEAGGTRVEMGMQKWLDKAAVAAVAALSAAATQPATAKPGSADQPATATAAPAKPAEITKPTPTATAKPRAQVKS